MYYTSKHHAWPVASMLRLTAVPGLWPPLSVQFYRTLTQNIVWRGKIAACKFYSILCRVSTDLLQMRDFEKAESW